MQFMQINIKFVITDKSQILTRSLYSKTIQYLLAFYDSACHWFK